ncbi:hypothetical protein NKR19_g6932 [Coniochaeta hoffmannii]|uniref:Uncharacterized protein n=1 Tax=Coniochaeta hoffmannii TaxID=91930 RepID=A0AA38VHL4_9PEZI|nr:hypothetical protein NKR19_g6932 [Coniochaeta hoffmannii]
MDDRMDAAYARRYLSNLPFHEHLTVLAPTASASKTGTRCETARKAYKVNKQRHVPEFIGYFKDYDFTGESTMKDSSKDSKASKDSHVEDTKDPDKHTKRHAPPHCRCHSCTGFRLHMFRWDLFAWGLELHHDNCNSSTPCTVFCPDHPNSIQRPASLTIEHLELAEQHGWNITPVLTGVGFDRGDHRPAGYANFTGINGISDLKDRLHRYKWMLHSFSCNPAKPCMPWCFKTAEQLTAEDIKHAKRKFPEWQKRMLASKGMATAVYDGMVERKKAKVETRKRLEAEKEKIGMLREPENRWSEAPVELAEFLGAYPRLHNPTCCREIPCVSMCVCFPEEAKAMTE